LKNRNNKSNDTKTKEKPAMECSWFHNPSTFNSLLAIFTLLLVIVAFLQWRTLEATKNDSRVRDRAYLSFSNPQIFPYPPPPKEPATIGVNVNLENHGNIPGKLISVRCGWTEDNENSVDFFPLAKLSEISVAKLIGPKQGMGLQGVEIPVATYEKAKQGKVNILVLMEVKYTDDFNNKKIRITRTSRSLRYDVHGGTSLGFAYNCVDEDCK